MYSLAQKLFTRPQMTWMGLVSKIILVGLVLMLTLFSSVAVANAQTRCWTTVGSTGTVTDLADSEAAGIDGNHIGIRREVSNATVSIRYNVTAVSGIFGGERNTKTIAVRFVDNGDAAQVMVKLQQLNLSTGSLSTLAELNSNNFQPNFQAQERVIPFNCQRPDFDFSKNVYYIVVELIKTGADGRPLIRGIRICGNGIC
ncbi:MAG: hypothetical protein F6K56_26885 [Moorea sp. SIO3G5]|nr:hypothetical protein [Moorena sp. SIO3G5]